MSAQTPGQAAYAPPSDAAITEWIENCPREFAAWLSTQERLGGVTPGRAALDEARKQRDTLRELVDDITRTVREWPVIPGGSAQVADWRARAGLPS